MIRADAVEHNESHILRTVDSSISLNVTLCQAIKQRIHIL
jgi:hypothetical protein